MKYYILILLISASIFSTHAQNIKENIKVSRTFQIAPTGTVEVSNKYGSIFIDVWEKDSVKVDIDFTVSEKNEAKFKKIKNSVDFEFSGNKLYRTVKTAYTSSYSSIFKDFKEATNLFTSNTEQTHVDYYITLPDYIHLKVDNKYGNIVLPQSYSGDLNINLTNGDLQAHDLKGTANLNLAFGNGNLNNIDQGNLNLNFCDISIKNSERLNINSKSSKIFLKNTNLLKLNAKRGKLQANTINYLYGDTEFTELNIDNLNKEISLNLTYGVIKMLNLSPEASTIKLQSKNANIRLKLNKETAYLIETTYTKASIKAFSEIKWENADTINDKGTLMRKGKHLNAENPSVINLIVTNAEVNIE